MEVISIIVSLIILFMWIPTLVEIFKEADFKGILATTINGWKRILGIKEKEE